MSRLFHFVLPSAWRDAALSGASEWSPPSLSSEGFVHLSLADQLRGTLAAHFCAENEVVVLELSLRDTSALRMEPSRGGALFPHLYRALLLEECVREHRLERRGDTWAGLDVLEGLG